jgi:hypothetical protein
MTSHLQFHLQMLNICFNIVPNPHFLGIFKGGAGVCTRIFRGGGGRGLYTAVLEIDRAFKLILENYSARSSSSFCEN